MSEFEATSEHPIHELRVAVLSLSQNALITTFGPLQLFRDTRQLLPNGFIGVTHEQRAITLLNREFPNYKMPSLKIIGRLGRLSATESGVGHEVCGIAVSTSEPHDFRRFQFKRYDIDEAIEGAQKEVLAPGSTSIDPIDAQFIINVSERLN